MQTPVTHKCKVPINPNANSFNLFSSKALSAACSGGFPESGCTSGFSWDGWQWTFGWTLRFFFQYFGVPQFGSLYVGNLLHFSWALFQDRLRKHIIRIDQDTFSSPWASTFSSVFAPKKSSYVEGSLQWPENRRFAKTFMGLTPTLNFDNWAGPQMKF